MTVECLTFEDGEDATPAESLTALGNDVAEVRQVRMLKYAVFERRSNDFLSKFRLIGMVSQDLFPPGKILPKARKARPQ